MSVMGSAWKSAKSFGLKGLLYGVVIGAAVGVVGVVALSAIIYGLEYAGLATVAGAVGGGGIAEAAGAASGLAVGGAALWSGTGFALGAAAGAAAGATIGGLGGLATGACYGAAMDESNPMPNVVEKAAHKILEKAPNLANSVAAKVNNQHAATAQFTQTTTTRAVTTDAPALAAPLESTSKAAASFQEKIATQAREPEMAVAAQR